MPLSTASGPRPQAPLLALDTASPTVSVAVVATSAGDRVLAQRALAQRQSSAILLRLVDEVLREADLRLEDLGGLVAVRGPGSFTGLRVGLATVLGLHQATGLPATALSALEVLAASAAAESDAQVGEEAGTGLDTGLGRPVLALVDARRGDYFGQSFAPGAAPRALDSPRRWTAAELIESGAAALVGHELGALRALPGWPADTGWYEPGPLAAAAARLAARHDGSWSPELLTSPLYLEAPAVGPPAR